MPGEEGDEGGIKLKEVVQGWSTSSMLKKKKKKDSSLALELAGDL